MTGASAPTAELSVRLQPRSSRTEIAGARDGVLIARVTALRAAVGLTWAP